MMNTLLRHALLNPLRRSLLVRIAMPRESRFSSTAKNLQTGDGKLVDDFAALRQMHKAAQQKEMEAQAAAALGPVVLTENSSMLEKFVFRYLEYARRRLAEKQRVAAAAHAAALAATSTKQGPSAAAAHASATAVSSFTAAAAATTTASAGSKTWRERLVSPLVWLLDAVIDKQLAQAEVERNARTMYDLLCASSKNTVLQSAFGLPETFRTYLSLWSIHLFVCINEMQARHRTPSAVKTVSIIFTRFKEDFTSELKARGVKLTFKHYAANEDLLQAAHRQFASDLRLPVEERFMHLLASVWVYVFVASVPPAELANAARRDQLVAGARLLTKYLIDNTNAVAAAHPAAFLSGAFHFQSLPKLSKTERAVELNDALIKSRRTTQAPINEW